MDPENAISTATFAKKYTESQSIFIMIKVDEKVLIGKDS